MEPNKRQQVLLAILLVVLAAALAYRFWPEPAPQAGSPSSGPGARGSAGAPGQGAGGSAAAVNDVHLEALKAARPAPPQAERNLFRFKSKAAPVSPPSVGRAGTGPAGSTGAPAAPPPPAGPPPPPPIALKFIGIVESGAAGPKIAVLSDPRGVYQGKEGDTIEGRYRILRIGTESIEIAYLDGRGRQTIRLTGQ